jgi:phytoene synthase
VTSLLAKAELDAAGITSPALRASYARCRALNAEHGKSYYLATLLLPPAKRPFVHALYGFARHVDDLVDDLSPTLTGAQRADRLQGWAGDFLADVDWGATSDPVSRAVLDTIERWQIPVSYFADFLDAMRMDLTVTGYETYEDLAAYMWGSAAVIGLQMLPILGRADDRIEWHRLEAHAVDLGTAFQLTNFIRDIREDLNRGRVYLPRESLREFGVDRDRLARGRVDESIRSLLAWEIERARGLYRRAEPGIALVHPTSRDCLETALRLYEGILDEIEAADYDVFSNRISVGVATRARVGLHGLRQARATRREYPPEPGPATPTSPGSRPPWRSRIADLRRGHTRSAGR